MRKIIIHSTIRPEIFWIEWIEPGKTFQSTSVAGVKVINHGPWPALCSVLGIDVNDKTETNIEFADPEALDKWNQCSEIHVRTVEDRTGLKPPIQNRG